MTNGTVLFPGWNLSFLNDQRAHNPRMTTSAASGLQVIQTREGREGSSRVLERELLGAASWTKMGVANPLYFWILAMAQEGIDLET